MLSEIAELLTGSGCPGCGAPGWRVCPTCEADWSEPPQRFTRGLLRARRVTCWAAASYEGPLRHMLVTYKEERVWRSAAPLSGLLARAGAAAVLQADVARVLLIPVPSAPSAVRRRGLDTTALLAARAARALSVAGVGAQSRRWLRQGRTVADQAGLDARARALNLQGALVASRVAGRSVLLVDDVVTTGASLAAATDAVRAAGGRVVGAAVVAARGWA